MNPSPSGSGEGHADDSGSEGVESETEIRARDRADRELVGRDFIEGGKEGDTWARLSKHAGAMPFGLVAPPSNPNVRLAVPSGMSRVEAERRAAMWEGGEMTVPGTP